MLFQVEKLSLSGPNGEPILSDLSFSLQEGEKLGIIGENGSGKSMFLVALLGLDSAMKTTGEIQYYLGDNSGDGWEKMGYVAQNPEDNFLALKVEEELLFGPRMRHWSEERKAKASEQYLEMFHLSEKSQNDIERISWGEKKLLAIASSLMLEPVLLLLDDPFSGLGRKSVETLTGVLKGFPGSLIITGLDESIVKPVVDRVMVLDNGAFLQQ